MINGLTINVEGLSESKAESHKKKGFEFEYDKARKTAVIKMEVSDFSLPEELEGGTIKDFHIYDFTEPWAPAASDIDLTIVCKS